MAYNRVIDRGFKGRWTPIIGGFISAGGGGEAHKRQFMVLLWPFTYELLSLIRLIRTDNKCFHIFLFVRHSFVLATFKTNDNLVHTVAVVAVEVVALYISSLPDSSK